MNFLSKVLRFLTGESTTINPGAVIPIVVRVPEVYPKVAHCLYAPDSEHPLSIGMHESWTKGCSEVLHEYQHVIERRLVQAGNAHGLQTVRQAFRDLCAPGFELGHDDLMNDSPYPQIM